MKQLNRYDVVRYCIKNNYFINGDMTQYNRVQKYADENPNDFHTIAIMIWICTNIENNPCTIESIEQDLKDIVKGVYLW